MNLRVSKITQNPLDCSRFVGFIESYFTEKIGRLNGTGILVQASN